MTVAGLGIIGVWWLSRLITGDTGSMNPVGLYAECSTMATIVILFVYFLTMLSLPFFMWHRHRDSFSPLRHVAIPALGSITLIVPFARAVPARAARPLQRLPVPRAGACRGGRGGRLAGRPASSARRSRRGSRIPGDLTGWPAEYLPWHTGSCS